MSPFSPPHAARPQAYVGHVFLSYVRENAALVDRLAATLRRHNLTVWVDRDSLVPGLPWLAGIERAIGEGGHFVPCFSAEACARSENGMDREVALAARLLARRPRDRAWFLPVRLTPCDIAQCQSARHPIGGGLTLADLEAVDLFGDREHGVQRLLMALAGTPGRAGAAAPAADAQLTADRDVRAAGSIRVTADAQGRAAAEAGGPGAALSGRDVIAGGDIEVTSRRRY